MMSRADTVAERVGLLRERIERSGRHFDEVRVVAVTKGFGPEAVEASVAAGLVDCGENYAQALLGRVAKAPPIVRWHFLGPVQRNKVRALAPLVALWHGVDRLGAGTSIAAHRPGAAVLVQVNLVGDPARPGCSWEAAPALVAGLRSLDLDVQGLMGVAGQGAGEAGAQFSRLAAMARRLELAELSMGMSGDLEVALAEGATIIRVGTALFGARPGVCPARR